MELETSQGTSMQMNVAQTLARVAFKQIPVFTCEHEAGLAKQGRSCPQVNSN